MPKRDAHRRENLTPAADLYREISEAADVPGSDREILEKAHKFVERGSHFDKGATATVRHMISLALLGNPVHQTHSPQVELSEEQVMDYLRSGRVDSPEMAAELNRQQDDSNSLLSRMSARLSRAARLMADPDGPLMGFPIEQKKKKRRKADR